MSLPQHGLKVLAPTSACQSMSASFTHVTQVAMLSGDVPLHGSRVMDELAEVLRPRYIVCGGEVSEALDVASCQPVRTLTMLAQSLLIRSSRGFTMRGHRTRTLTEELEGT